MGLFDLITSKYDKSQGRRYYQDSKSQEIHDVTYKKWKSYGADNETADGMARANVMNNGDGEGMYIPFFFELLRFGYCLLFYSEAPSIPYVIVNLLIWAGVWGASNKCVHILSGTAWYIHYVPYLIGFGVGMMAIKYIEQTEFSLKSNVISVLGYSIFWIFWLSTSTYAVVQWKCLNWLPNLIKHINHNFGAWTWTEDFSSLPYPTVCLLFYMVTTPYLVSVTTKYHKAN